MTKDCRPQTTDPLFDLTSRVAVVTGGMGQLGVTYAGALARRGAHVALLDTATRPKFQDAQFAAAMAEGRIVLFPADITDRVSVERALGEIEVRFGIPHVLINNAALDSPPDAPASEVGPYETYPDSSFDRVMAVNVKGTHICCQVIGGRMADKGRGSIVNISSTYGILSPCQDIYEFRRRNGETFYKPVAYSVSKSAVLNLTRYLATYWAKKGVRVNTLTLAGVFNNQPKEFLEAYCARIPVGRMGAAEDYVGPIVFLASDASRYMTGANLIVDGGWSAW